MKSIITVLLLVGSYALFSQSGTENYTKTISPKTALSITELEAIIGNTSYPETLTLENPVSSGNYIAKTEIFLVNGFHATGTVSISIIGSGVNENLLESISYYDGLGRATQSIAKAQSPEGRDVVAFSKYDEFGRAAKNYLPYASTQNTGNFIVDPMTPQISYYQTNYGDAQSYGESSFDGSPLNRVEEVASPGYDWRIIPGSDLDHTRKLEYGTNVSNTEVRKFTVDDSGSSVVVTLDYYNSLELLRNITKNENWQPSDGLLNTIETYSKKNGQVIAQITYEQGTSSVLTNITQNVYDLHGRLRLILPPPMMEIIENASGGFTLNSTTIEQYKDLIYQYEYDEFNRKIAQRTPNKVWEYYVYDQLDRPVFVQDANLAHLGKWYFTKYDVFGRPIYTGTYRSIGTSGNQEQLQQAVDTYIAANTNNLENAETRTAGTISIGGIALNYSNNAFPVSDVIEVLTVNYYDDYNFTDSDKPATPVTIEGQTVTTRTKGLSTASFSKTIDGSTWSKVYYYYDEKASEIKIFNKNWKGGYTTTDSKLDFRGKIESSITKHKMDISATELVINDRFTYDHAERSLGHFQKINTQDEERISENEYDELGMLVKKSVGGKTSATIALQDLDYKYNIRGQFVSLNDVDNLGTDFFAIKLKYNEAKEGHSVWTIPKQYNGNISQALWSSAYAGDKKSYVYTYDKLNRLENSYFEDTGNSNIDDLGYSLSLTYDRNGNISTLQRRNSGGHASDNLTYTYETNSNQLLRVTDPPGYYSGDGLFTTDNTSGDDYDYHFYTGALIQDLNKDIDYISYNVLDLTKRVQFSNNSRFILNTYSANGQKLEKRYSDTGVPDQRTTYHGGFQYLNDELQFFPTPEGYVKKSGNDYEYVYLYVDHLGNNRVSYSDVDADGVLTSSELLSSRDYDPFGGEIPNYTNYVDSYASGFNYLYQGKELNQEGGLNWHDFGSRNYDAALGRWVVPDPQNQFASPYLAMGNNPVLLTDPNGEYAFFDDIAAILIGGTVNVVSNWSNIDGDWGKGFSYFGIGAAAGEASLYGGPLAGAAVLGLGNSAYNQYNQTGSIDPDQLVFDGLVSVGTAYVGGAFSSALAPHAQKLFGSGNSLFSKYASEAVTNVASGVVIETSLGVATGNSFNAALNGAIEGIPQSLAISAISTTGTHYRNKYYAGKAAKEAALQQELLQLESNQVELNIPAIEMTTSSKLTTPSRNYTIYLEDGITVFKFGVTDAEGIRFRRVLKYEAPANSTGVLSKKIVPKYQAHKNEKYMRSLYFNTTGIWAMDGMLVPYPVDFDTYKRIKQ